MDQERRGYDAPAMMLAAVDRVDGQTVAPNRSREEPAGRRAATDISLPARR